MWKQASGTNSCRGVDDSEDYVFEAGTSEEGIDNSHEPARTMHDGIYGTYVGDVSDREFDDDSTWLDAFAAHVGTYVERSPRHVILNPSLLEHHLMLRPDLNLG